MSTLQAAVPISRFQRAGAGTPPSSGRCSPRAWGILPFRNHRNQLHSIGISVAIWLKCRWCVVDEMVNSADSAAQPCPLCGLARYAEDEYAGLDSKIAAS
jgi:hypothetical protein